MKPPIKNKWYDLITIDLMASNWNTYYPDITLYNFLVIKNYSRSNPALSFKIWKLFIKFIYLIKGYGWIDFIDFRCIYYDAKLKYDFFIKEELREFSNSPTKHQDCEPETLEDLCERLDIKTEKI